MLRLLRVENFALIDALTLEFQGGLNVLSGETGAGKSLIVDALSLVAGARASADWIRTGEERALVEIVADAPTVDLAALGLDAADGEIVLRREISADGRNRVFVNNQAATVAALRAIAPALLDIHGQHEQQGLLSGELQLAHIDRVVGAEDLRERVRHLFGQIRELRAELADLGSREAEALGRQDLLRFQEEEIATAGPTPGETARLRAQVGVLEHAGRLAEAAGSAYDALYERDDALIGTLGAVVRLLEGERSHDARLEPILGQLAAGRTALEEASWQLREYLGGLELDPAEMGRLQSRLAELERLERKYGSDLLAHLEKVRQELDSLGLRSERTACVIEELSRLEREYGEAARELGQRRRSRSGELEERVTAQIRTLAMPEARFSIGWEDTGAPHATGLERTVWYLAPNPGEESGPLAAIASGGELSRTMLALRSVLAARGGPATLVFDEIDAGVGGEAAEQVGRKLVGLAAEYQVLCVTHLPQIARFADHHSRIEKEVEGGRTRTRISRLDSDQRVEELARMMSGKRVTAAARRHVRELLARDREPL